MKLSNTFKRELTKQLNTRFPNIEIQHEDNYISFKWKEVSPDTASIELHWMAIQNGGRNKSTVLHTFGNLNKKKSEYHEKLENDILDFSQRFLDSWIKMYSRHIECF